MLIGAFVVIGGGFAAEQSPYTRAVPMLCAIVLLKLCVDLPIHLWSHRKRPAA